MAVTGSTALVLALTAGLAAPTSGRWVAGLGWHQMGLLAAHELGVSWERLVLVGTPTDPRRQAAALAAAVEAFDVVVACPGGHSESRTAGNAPIRPVDARRIRARARERGAVLVVVDHRARAVPPNSASTLGRQATSRSNGAGPTGPWWPEPAEVELRVTDGSWQGLGHGHGHLRGRRVTIEATGRGRLARARRQTLWLPAVDGGVHPAEPADAPEEASSGIAPLLPGPQQQHDPITPLPPASVSEDAEVPEAGPVAS